MRPIILIRQTGTDYQPAPPGGGSAPREIVFCPNGHSFLYFARTKKTTAPSDITISPPNAKYMPVEKNKPTHINMATRAGTG